MVKAIIRLITKRGREKKAVLDRLHYLSGIKPIETDKRILDECTVTK